MKKIIKKIYLLFRRVWSLPLPLLFNSKVDNSATFDKRYVSLLGSKYLSIGHNTLIMSGARIEAITEDSNARYCPQIHIGENVCINQNFHCTCASKISIGDGTSITANCGVFDIIHPYENVNINPRNQPIKTLPITIGKNCLIGMNTVLLPGVEFGDHVIVGCNSTVIAGKYPSYCVLVGSPARIVKKYDQMLKEWVKV